MSVGVGLSGVECVCVRLAATTADITDADVSATTGVATLRRNGAVRRASENMRPCPAGGAGGCTCAMKALLLLVRSGRTGP